MALGSGWLKTLYKPEVIIVNFTFLPGRAAPFELWRFEPWRFELWRFELGRLNCTV